MSSCVSPIVGAFGGNEEESLLHHGREGMLEQAQGTVLRIFLFSLPLSLSNLPSLLLPVTYLPPPSPNPSFSPPPCCLSPLSQHCTQKTDMMWWCVYRSRVHGEATTFGSMYLTTTPRRDTWRAYSKRTALSGTQQANIVEEKVTNLSSENNLPTFRLKVGNR